MGHEVLSSRSYEYLDEGYLVDNGPWQEKIKKMSRRLENSGAIVSWPTLGVDELKPNFFPENADAEALPTAIVDPAVEAQEKAKAIERSAKKSAYEIVEKARWEAEELLNSAKTEAEKDAAAILETAREEGHKQGFEKGKEDGFAQGEQDGKNSYSHLIANLNELIGNLVAERKKLIGDLQPMVVDLVGAALKRCLNKEAKKGTLVVTFVKEALSKAQDKVRLNLHLNPDDMAEIEAQKKKLELTVGAGDMELIADARIERGGCLLNTEGGTVDVRLNTVVEQVKESITSEMKK